MRPLTALGTDARQALRGMRARPGFAFAAITMLALGIGITTAMFTIVDALLLRGGTARPSRAQRLPILIPL